MGYSHRNGLPEHRRSPKTDCRPPVLDLSEHRRSLQITEP